MTENKVDMEKIASGFENLRTEITKAHRKARNSKLMKQFVKGVVIGGVVGTVVLISGAIVIEVAQIEASTD